MTLILAVGAGSLFAITSSTGEQPTPVVVVETAAPNEPASVSGDIFPTVGYQPATIDDVEVEVGVGPPIPVHAIVSANLPKSCGQLGEIQMHRNGNSFFVRLIGHLPAQTECNTDSLPLRLEIPLNIVNLPEGTYEVNVNGATTTSDMPVQ